MSKKKTKNKIVYTKNLNKVYEISDEIRVHALIDVDLDVNEGDFISIMGPSGSGKTTLMNMIGMLDRPTLGEIEIAGVDTTEIAEKDLYKIRRNKIGFIFQKFYLIPTLSALDNVLSPLLPLGISERKRKRAIKLMKEVGLEDRMNHKPNELSGGQLQRVAIARSLIMNPPIVLADEPTGNLDSITGADIINLMKKMNKEMNTTFIIVTHDPRIAEATDRIVYLEDGRTSEKPTVEMQINL